MTSAPPRPGQRIRIGGVGESAERPDGVPKVTGEFAYASDLHAEQMLHGQTLRSPHAHARILSLDTRTARAMPGVRAVLTSGDIPGSALFGLEHADQPALAIDRVRYAGEPVAIVAAEHPEQARAAVHAIRVTYETLPAVTDPIAALRPDAPVIHDRGNVIKEVTVVHGDPEARGEIVLEGGAYASSTGAVVANAACFAAGPYLVPNAVVRCVGAYTNNPPTGAMRGFGAVQSCFAYEAQMDQVARRCRVDPVEIRARNGLREGDAIITSQPMVGSAPVAELVRRCADLPLPDDDPSGDDVMSLPGGAGNLARSEDVVRGIGYAAGFKNVCYSHGFDDYATARVRLERDDRGLVARVHTAAAEVGQGIVSICAQIARTELGIERVEIEPADTTIDSAGSSSASRQTWMTGSAVMLAARQVREDLERRGGDVGAAIEKTVVYRHRPTELLNETAQNHGHVAFLFAAHRAVVDVDRETGLVKVVQVATSQDVGKAINPTAVVGQIEGGIAQGLGLAVMEEVQLRDGKMLNASFTDYLLPTILDMPPVVADVVEHPHPDAPYGAKGVGEPPTISSTPAIVAAIRAATGRVLNRVPVRPDDIVFGETARSGWRIEPGADPRSAIA